MLKLWTTLHGRPAATLAVLFVLCGCGRQTAKITDETSFRAALAANVPVIVLAGVIALQQPIELEESTAPLEISGDAVLRPASGFRGPALLRAQRRSHLHLSGFTVDGFRPDQSAPVGLPPSNQSFARFYQRNGIIIEGGEEIRIEGLQLRRITDFPLIVSGSRHVRIEGVTVEDSGSLNERGKNNTSGGILLEEGTSNFAVLHCTVRRILGNGIWTHSNGEPRSARGVITENRISDVARDAIQIGHATEVRVEHNRGERIGYPARFVDAAAHAIPVALDTAGNVDRTVYRENNFTDVNGECINLDGFHHGEVRDNTCESTRPFAEYPYAHYGIVMGNSDPGMESTSIVIADNRITGTGYGGLFLIGTGHTVTGNRFDLLNRAECTGDGKVARCNYALDQPGMLRTGIYLAGFANRETRTNGNTIRGNYLRGFGMGRWCIAAAPGLSLKSNTIGDNECTEDSGNRSRN